MIGILALQGGVEEHEAILDELGLEHRRVKSLADVSDLNGFILPGGESTVMRLFLKEYGLEQWLQAFDGPIYGSCAGLILLSRLGLLNVEVERNAYGRQLASFQADLYVKGLGALKGAFIRAPQIVSVGEGVELLAEHKDIPVLVRQASVWASSFHPELMGETGLHALIFKS